MVFLRILMIGMFLLSTTPIHSNASDLTSSITYNNTIAIAVPLTDIQIDGDLSDWPSDLPIYKLRERWDNKGPFDTIGALLDTSADFNPYFRVGYNLQYRSLYVAIETRDDTLHTGDASEIYLHTTEDLKQNPLHFLREYHEGEVDISNNLDFLDALFFTDKHLAESGTKVAVEHLNNITIYEWSLKLPDHIVEKLAHAHTEVRIRLDVNLADIDNDDGEGNLYLSWSPGSEKDGNALALGGLVFAEGSSKLIHLEGTLQDQDGNPLVGLKIRIANPDIAWIDEVLSGNKGHFTTWALPGDLQVSVRGLVAADTSHLSPAPGTRTNLTLKAPHFNEKIHPILVADPEDISNSIYTLEGARFRFGDDPGWANTDVDDRDWGVINTATNKFTVPKDTRVVWIRQHLIAQQEIADTPLVLRINWEHADSLTYYLNGKTLPNFRDKATGGRTIVTLSDDHPSLLAIRYAYKYSENLSTSLGNYNFRLDHAAPDLQKFIDGNQLFVALLSLFVGMPLILSIVHLLMYWFYREQKEHLHYALLTFSVVLGVVSIFGNQYLNWKTTIGQGTLFVAGILLVELAYVRFICAVFNRSDLLLYRIFLGASISLFLMFLNFSLGDLLAKFNPLELTAFDFEDRKNFYYLSVAPLVLLLLGLFIWFHHRKEHPDRLVCWSAVLIGFLFYAAWISNLDDKLFIVWLATITTGFIAVLYLVYWAVRQKEFGATTMAVGVTMQVVAIYGGFVTVINVEGHTGFLLFFSILIVGHFALILASSIHLARVVGRTGQRLEEQLVRVETLSQTNLEQERTLRQRMEEELEGAHQLQISMLPNHVPEHPAAEVDWTMKTATEVGGDYFDYRIADDDRLTLILGDATGHGMQSGTLVTATKSLFQSLTNENNLASTVTKMSQNLKSMNLKRLGMALTLVELDGRKLSYCAAGIPPILIYRAQKDTVEEGQTGGLPIGLSTRGSYQQTEVTLDRGDAVLLMSDGLPERTNEAEEEFGYQRVQELFLNVAQGTPTEICKRMAAGGDEWAAGKEQDDDVSFVAVRIR